MSRFWNPILRDLKPYVPGEQPKADRLVKLNTNENPYGPSPLAVAAIQADANDSLRLYPDPEATALREAIARYHGLSLDQVFVGNGSDEILAHTFLGLLKHENRCSSGHHLQLLSGLLQTVRHRYQEVPLTPAMEIDTADYVDQTCGGIIFPNPNAPTGIELSLAKIEELLIKAAERSRCHR